MTEADAVGGAADVAVPARSAAPPTYAVDGGTLALSGAALRECLAAVLERRAAFRFTALGSSMWPFIRDGDALTVSPPEARPPRVGAVVAFRLPERDALVVHRIVAVDEPYFMLRGDNADEPDGLVATEHVLGVVTRVERRGRAVVWTWAPAARLVAGLSRRGRLRPLVDQARRLLRPLVGGRPA